MKTIQTYLDTAFKISEEFPKKFEISFKEISQGKKNMVQVKLNDFQVGDVISDNAYENDYYRYHDIFHYTFATMLEWSPCTRAMMKRKRKSDPVIDEVEDGARATITEEAISLL